MAQGGAFREGLATLISTATAHSVSSPLDGAAVAGICVTMNVPGDGTGIGGVVA